MSIEEIDILIQWNEIDDWLHTFRLLVNNVSFICESDVDRFI